MALKSGLLLETTWALNVLTVWLYDDHAVGSFSLAKMPGILQVNFFKSIIVYIFFEYIVRSNINKLILIIFILDLIESFSTMLE